MMAVDAQKNTAVETQQGKRAVLTVQAAGVRTTVGNEHVHQPGSPLEPYSNLNVTAALNGQSIGVWTIP
jgi:hypothetical protein